MIPKYRVWAQYSGSRNASVTTKTGTVWMELNAVTFMRDKNNKDVKIKKGDIN